MAFALLSNKEATDKLFETLAGRFTEREGGYTRILRTGYRVGDGAEMAIIEYLPAEEKKAAAKGKKKAAAKKAAGKTEKKAAPRGKIAGKAEKKGSVRGGQDVKPTRAPRKSPPRRRRAGEPIPGIRRKNGYSRRPLEKGAVFFGFARKGFS